MREDLIMALAEDITMVMILSIVIGLIAGWYFTYLYYHSHDPEVTDLVKRLPPSQLPTPQPPKRYRRLWRFVPVSQKIKTLQNNADWMANHGFAYQPDASSSSVLAFMKLEEVTESVTPKRKNDEEEKEND